MPKMPILPVQSSWPYIEKPPLLVREPMPRVELLEMHRKCRDLKLNSMRLAYGEELSRSERWEGRS